MKYYISVTHYFACPTFIFTPMLVHLSAQAIQHNPETYLNRT